MNLEDYDPYQYFAEQIKRFVPTEGPRQSCCPAVLGMPYGLPADDESTRELEETSENN
jgi:hypothetical protein